MGSFPAPLDVEGLLLRLLQSLIPCRVGGVEGLRIPFFLSEFNALRFSKNSYGFQTPSERSGVV